MQKIEGSNPWPNKQARSWRNGVTTWLFLRVLRFSSLSKIDSQSKTSGLGAVLQDHAWPFGGSLMHSADPVWAATFAIQSSRLEVRVISRTLLLSLKRQTNGKIDLMVSIPQVPLKHCYFTGSTNQSYVGQTREIRVGVTATCDRPIAASSGALLEREKGYLHESRRIPLATEISMRQSRSSYLS